MARLTHAAGLSATGDPDLDARLPLPERLRIPPETVAAIARTRQRGGRVMAVGTTVVRALEGAALDAGARPGSALLRLRAGPGETDLRLGPHHELRVVQGLLSGLHDPEESHFQLLHAFAHAPLLESAHALALAHGYLSHELGDTTLDPARPRRGWGAAEGANGRPSMKGSARSRTHAARGASLFGKAPSFPFPFPSPYASPSPSPRRIPSHRRRPLVPPVPIPRKDAAKCVSRDVSGDGDAYGDGDADGRPVTNGDAP